MSQFWRVYKSQDEVMTRKPEADEEGNHDDDNDKAALDDMGIIYI